VLPNPTSTAFVTRLRARDPAAWFELWENFGPVLRAQLARWGRGSIGPETVADLSQETLAALTDAIDRHDPSRGARFSTWLLAIAKHSFFGEMDRRNAAKRGSGRRSISLEDTLGGSCSEPGPDMAYERSVFEAKVIAALRSTERECGFTDFGIYRARVFEGKNGKEVAQFLALSEATVSRRLTAVRERIRLRLAEVFARYSFSEEDWRELERNGLDPNPNKGLEATFDAAIAEVYHRFADRQGPAATPTSPAARPPAPERAGGPLSRVVRSLFPKRDPQSEEAHP